MNALHACDTIGIYLGYIWDKKDGHDGHTKQYNQTTARSSVAM